MTVAEAYEKYKHLDELLSDSKWAQSPLAHTASELWIAIKGDVLKNDFAKSTETNERKGVHTTACQH